MRLVLTLIFIFICNFNAKAKEITNLIADEIKINQEGDLVAEGAVTIWYENRKITATSITYSSYDDKLKIEGPIRLTDETETVILAHQAMLSKDLQVGIITSAKIILGQHVQIAASKISQKGSRYSTAFDVAATSCHVCINDIPLWQIRAKKIVHDRLEKQIYFENSQLRVLDIPLLYLPLMRLPDPTLKRASGFLVPKLKTSTLLNAGIKIPYFIKLGDYKDLTLTPFYSPKTNTLDFRYRHFFKSGELEVNSALTRDTLKPSDTRAYIFSNANFDFQNGYNLDLQLQAVNDPSYLFDYDLAQVDRLKSKMDIQRSQRNQNSGFKFSNYHSLREGESNSTQPALVTEGIIEKRIQPRKLIGEVGIKANFLSSYRYSDLAIDSLDADDDIDGYDTTRVSLLANWNHSQEMHNGLILDFSNDLGISEYKVKQHSEIGPSARRFFGSAAVGIRWPFSKINHDNGSGIIEPRIQLVGLVMNDGNVPNEDSTQIELDEGNLFRLNRAPGLDLIEHGTRLNAGITGSHINKVNTKLNWKIGRIFRLNGLPEFSPASGLSGSTSDWLLATNLELRNGLQLISRALLTPNGSVTKSETSLNVLRDQHHLTATHVELTKDADDLNNKSLSSVAVDWNYQLTSDWQSNSKIQIDTNIGRLSKLELGVKYENECVDVNLSTSRSFSTSSTLLDKTDFTLSVELTGYSSNTRKIPKLHNCGI